MPRTSVSSMVASISKMCMARCSSDRDLVHLLEGPAPRVVRLVRQDGWRDGLGLLPAAQAAELRVERQHVGQRGGAGAGKAVDVDRAPDRQRPRPRDGSAYHASTSSRLTSRRRKSPRTAASASGLQVTVAFEALEQDLEALAEVAGAEVGETRLRDGLAHELVGRGIARRSLPFSRFASCTRSG